ncbi:MAG TPA: hypothetical protein VFH68_13765 [Polyangia bacterium]|nr:hypothetical protein [Polyangia bacterium]
MKHSAKRLTCSWIAGGLLLGLAAIGSGCAGVKQNAGGVGGSGAHPGTGGRGVPVQPCRGPNGLCEDFPTAPIVDSGASTNICNAPSGNGPCITEPEDGSLFPNNWLRPRVSVQGVGGPMKITFHSERETNDLVVYTTANNWKMPKDIWDALTSHVQDSSIEVTVCGASGGASKTHFTIAPAGAGGSMVFWAANPAFVGTDQHACQASLTPACLSVAELRGFEVGSETTANVLSLSQVAQRSRTDSGDDAPVTCIGCHSATPDKSFVTFADSYPWRTATASVAGTGVTPNPSGATFPSMTPAGLAALLQPGWGPFTFSISKADTNPFWQPGRRIGVGALGLKVLNVPDNSPGPDRNDSPHLAWFNLEATNVQTGNDAKWSYVSFAPDTAIDSGNALGFIAHTGDMCGSVACGAGMPNWSHDGTKILYVSTNAVISGRFNIETKDLSVAGDLYHSATPGDYNDQRVPGMTNLYTVPFNNGRGGTASPVQGAATTQLEEFYPAYSPDDQLIAYTAVPAGETMYANPHEEIYAVSANGGTGKRLKANEPPSCTGKISPGVNNHWPKWSPDVVNGPRGSKYYWMIFSSNRADIPQVRGAKNQLVSISQLYLAPIVVTETGDVGSYPAIYLWNQPIDRVNTTPAWETFELPPIP